MGSGTGAPPDACCVGPFDDCGAGGGLCFDSDWPPSTGDVGADPPPDSAGLSTVTKFSVPVRALRLCTNWYPCPTSSLSADSTVTLFCSRSNSLMYSHGTSALSFLVRSLLRGPHVHPASSFSFAQCCGTTRIIHVTQARSAQRQQYTKRA